MNAEKHTEHFNMLYPLVNIPGSSVEANVFFLNQISDISLKHRDIYSLILNCTFSELCCLYMLVLHSEQVLSRSHVRFRASLFGLLCGSEWNQTLLESRGRRLLRQKIRAIKHLATWAMIIYIVKIFCWRQCGNFCVCLEI